MKLVMPAPPTPVKRDALIMSPGVLAIIAHYCDQVPERQRDRYRRMVEGRLRGQPRHAAVDAACIAALAEMGVQS